MAEIRTTVTLTRKEIDDALIASAKGSLKECVGSSCIEYRHGKNDDGPESVVVTFGGKVRT